MINIKATKFFQFEIEMPDGAAGCINKNVLRYPYPLILVYKYDALSNHYSVQAVN